MGLSDEHLAAICILPISTIGLFSNLLVSCFITRSKWLQNSFGMLLSSQAAGDAVHSFFFTLHFITVNFLILEKKPKPSSRHWQFFEKNSAVTGHFLLIAYDISTYSHFLISINRFCSICYAIKYHDLFSERNTKLLIIFSWVLAVLPSIYFYVYEDCQFAYVNEFWAFVFSNTPICLKITWYGDFLKYNIIIISIAIIDILTVLKVRRFKKKIQQTTCSIQSQKKRNDINFLKQACLQGFTFVCELLTYFVISPNVDPSNKWIRFFLTTFAWVSIHSLDGVITIVFNIHVFSSKTEKKSTTLKYNAEPRGSHSNRGFSVSH